MYSYDTSHTPAPCNGAAIKASVTVSASKTSGQIVAVQNNQDTPVIAEITRVHIKTGSSAACTLNIGTAANSTTSSDNLIDGVSVNAASNTIYDSITDGGTNGKTRQYLDTGDYFTVSVATGDANGLVADFYFLCQSLVGGSSPNVA